MYDINLHGGPRHGFRATLHRLPQGLVMPDEDVLVDAWPSPINILCPPGRAHLYRLQLEMLSPRGEHFGTYWYEETRMPDGSRHVLLLLPGIAQQQLN